MRSVVQPGKVLPGDQTRRKQNLVLAGIAVSLLILGSLIFAVSYKFMAMQSDVTAFQVGKQQSATQYIGGGGIVYPHQQLDLSYPVAERAISVLVKAGDQVKPGQALIKLDPAQLNVQINQASNDVSAAQAYLNSVANATPYSAVTVAAAQQALQVAQSKYNALVAQTSSSFLQNGNLVSPVQGVVTTVNINSGEVFGANAILLTLMDQSSVTVRTKIPLANLGQVHNGMQAQVSPSALPNLTLKGTVSSVIPQADAQTDTFEVWVQVTNPQQAILPGMSAFVRIQSAVNAFVLPRLAVLNPDHESSVFVIRNGYAHMQTVHVVGRSTDSVYVDTGVAPDDHVVLLPLDKVLRDGQAVNVTSVEH